MASPLISDQVRYKVDHTKFYHVKVGWRAILKYDDTVFNYLDKQQAVNVIRLLKTNPFVEDIAVYDNEGNIKHFDPTYDETYAAELLKEIHKINEQYGEMEIKHRTNQTWHRILLERKTQLKETQLANPDKQCKLFKGKVMIKGVNCMIEGASRSDGAEFPPDCEGWWKT